MSKRFLIAFSFAGERRDFVKKVADLLAARFSKTEILFDEFHESEFARYDLGIYLPVLYGEQSCLIVPVLSPAYDTKRWTGWEWGHIYGLLTKADGHRVMPSRFDYAKADGLSPTAGFIELDRKTPEQFATLILERLALNEGLPKDHYTKPASATRVADWPIAAPLLHWPVADHTDAREAFAKLITRGSAHRYLPISGLSEMGKSHLTNQFLANAHSIDGLRCARFDFKGSADMDVSLATFAAHLEVPAPKPGTGVTAQLAEIFTALRASARPTLLIFDTFELAADADRWIKETLLLSLLKLPWMRVIIVGHKVPPSHAQPWAVVSAQLVVLHSPTAEDWFAYSQIHKPALTLDFVRQAHDCCGGKPITLDQLLGPTA